ncbi:MAG: tetratricopeptide repeat protein [Burkholderiales bacterium]
MNAASMPQGMGLAEAGMDQAWLERACFGQGVPEQAEIHLRLAGLAYQQDEVAESHLRQALEIAPDHAAVLIGLYRFYFYKGRLSDALAVAERCVVKAAADNGLAPDWRLVEHGDADFGSYAAILPRFYLFTLKAYGYLLMRLGRLEEGRAAILKLLELDTSDKVGGKVLLQVLDRMGRDDDYGE